jgi:hypothetical protein
VPAYGGSDRRGPQRAGKVQLPAFGSTRPLPAGPAAKPALALPRRAADATPALRSGTGDEWVQF